MAKLPRLTNNAYLKIYFDVEGIYAHLAYSHIEQGKSFIKSKFIPHGVASENLSSKELDRYIWELLLGLEEFFDWNMFQEISDRQSGVGQKLTHGESYTHRPPPKCNLSLVDLNGEGQGISGVEVKINELVDIKKGLLASVRNVVAEASVDVIGKKLYSKVAAEFGHKFSYTDILWIDVNVGSCQLLRLKSNDDEFDVFEETEYWSEKYTVDEMLDYPKESLVKSFMLESVPNTSSLINRWVNFVYGGSFYTESSNIQDVLRAANTSRLYSQFHGKDTFENFGVHDYLPGDYKSLDGFAVIITGGLTKTIPETDLLLSILDSLELQGYFDLFYDKYEKLVCFGESYFKGIEAEDIIVNRKFVIPVAQKVVIPEVSGLGSNRKVVMSGRLLKAGEAAEEIFCVTPEVREYKLPGSDCVLEANLVKGANLPDVGNRIEHTFVGEYLDFDKVIFDCRFRPVVYGPDAKSNRAKMAQWFNE
ncbi:hypothetical protein GF357_04535 [Candidatus Dojkabacteria bacterium]|nr:hypothetical protein [Candidatus Dojkabacteria bacterium]